MIPTHYLNDEIDEDITVLGIRHDPAQLTEPLTELLACRALRNQHWKLLLELHTQTDFACVKRICPELQYVDESFEACGDIRLMGSWLAFAALVKDPQQFRHLRDWSYNMWGMSPQIALDNGFAHKLELRYLDADFIRAHREELRADEYAKQNRCDIKTLLALNLPLDVLSLPGGFDVKRFYPQYADQYARAMRAGANSKAPPGCEDAMHVRCWQHDHDMELLERGIQYFLERGALSSLACLLFESGLEEALVGAHRFPELLDRVRDRSIRRTWEETMNSNPTSRDQLRDLLMLHGYGKKLDPTELDADFLRRYADELEIDEYLEQCYMGEYVDISTKLGRTVPLRFLLQANIESQTKYLAQHPETTESFDRATNLLNARD